MPATKGRPPHPDVLTPAEWRVVQFLRHGLSNRQIARRFGISLDAVKFHTSNIVSKLGLDGRAALKRWRGVPNDSALFQRSKTVNPTLELGPIGQISRSVKNIEHARAWYGDVLGLKHLYSFGKLAFFDCGGTRLFLEEAAAPGQESVLYLRVSDINGGYDALVARGVEFASPPHLIHRHEDGVEEWMAFFNDPEGRALAIMSQVRPLDAG